MGNGMICLYDSSAVASPASASSLSSKLFVHFFRTCASVRSATTLPKSRAKKFKEIKHTTFRAPLAFLVLQTSIMQKNMNAYHTRMSNFTINANVSVFLFIGVFQWCSDDVSSGVTSNMF